MAKPSGPKFIQYFQPVIDALHALGSSARPAEVYAWIIENKNVPAHEIEATNKGGQSKFENRVAWARFYLVKAGYLEDGERGIWVLSDKGRSVSFSHSFALEEFKRVQATFRADREGDQSNDQSVEFASTTDETEETTAPDEKEYLNQDEVQQRLVTLIHATSDKGFEEFCARLLRHIGFTNVKVTGKTGDQGVDGEGYLPINRFVRSKIMFQCKRYTSSAVGPKEIRDFRGALHGRAERGIFLTSGTFTRGAKEEAARENTINIELVDIDGLIDLMVGEKLGVAETKALRIDQKFFDPFLEKQNSTIVTQ